MAAWLRRLSLQAAEIRAEAELVRADFGAQAQLAYGVEAGEAAATGEPEEPEIDPLTERLAEDLRTLQLEHTALREESQVIQWGWTCIWGALPGWHCQPSSAVPADALRVLWLQRRQEWHVRRAARHEAEVQKLQQQLSAALQPQLPTDISGAAHAQRALAIRCCYPSLQHAIPFR